MKPRLLLPLGLTAMMGVGICIIPPISEAEEPGVVARKRPQILQMESRPDTVKPSLHPEAKEEPKPAPAPLTTEEKEQAAAQRAHDLSKMFVRYMAEHEGAMPPDTSALVATGLMDRDRTGEFLKGVIEYRGAEMTSKDDPGLTVLRYRYYKRTDKELRIHLSGAVRFCDPAEPIPEDAVEESQFPK
jgi:hypothetical protein